MKKTFKKVLALLLALTVVFTIPVIACAEDDGKFDYGFVGLEVTDGKWLKNYVNTIKLTIKGDGIKTVGTDVILTMGTNAAGDNMLKLKKSDLKIKFNLDTTTIEFKVDKKLDHAKDYTFCIKEGSFSTSSGTVNSEFKYSTTGNLIIETINEELSENPIGRLVKDMENSDYAWLWFPVIVILKWFMSL